MFYIVSMNLIANTVEVFDTDDSVTESFSIERIKDIVISKGISINGVKIVEGSIEIEVCEKPCIVFGKCIDNSLMDRESAICIINGVLYKSFNHQECIEEYLKSKGSSVKSETGLDLDDSEDFEKVCGLTHKAFSSCNMYGFDIYIDSNETGYLIAHFESNFIACYTKLVKYAKDNCLKLGTFSDSDNKMYLAEVINLKG